MLLCGNIVTMMFNMFVKFYVYIYVWFTTIILTDDNFLLQATSGKIACSNWLRRVTCRSVIFRIGPVRITGFVSHFGYKGTTKGNFEKLQTFNEFSRLSTKSCMSRTMNNLKESFTIMKTITTGKTTLEMTFLCHAIRM